MHKIPLSCVSSSDWSSRQKSLPYMQPFSISPATAYILKPEHSALTRFLLPFLSHLLIKGHVFQCGNTPIIDQASKGGKDFGSLECPWWMGAMVWSVMKKGRAVHTNRWLASTLQNGHWPVFLLLLLLSMSSLDPIKFDSFDCLIETACDFPSHLHSLPTSLPGTLLVVSIKPCSKVGSFYFQVRDSSSKWLRLIIQTLESDCRSQAFYYPGPL